MEIMRYIQIGSQREIVQSSAFIVLPKPNVVIHQSLKLGYISVE